MANSDQRDPLPIDKRIPLLAEETTDSSFVYSFASTTGWDMGFSSRSTARSALELEKEGIPFVREARSTSGTRDDGSDNFGRTS